MSDKIANKNAKNENSAPKRKRFSLLRRLFGRTDFKELDIMAQEIVESPGKSVWNNFKSRKIAVFSCYVLIFMFLLCFLGPVIWRVDVYEQEPTMQNKRPGLNFLRVPGELNNGALDIAVGSGFGAGITKDGKKLLVWGDYNKKIAAVPKLNPGETWTKVACGSTHIVAATSKNRVLSWGDNMHGLPTPPVFAGNVKDVYAGRYVSCVIDDAGGCNYWGATLNMKLSTAKVPGKIVDQHFARSTAIVLTEDGHCAVLDRTKSNIFEKVPKEVQQGNIVSVAATDMTAFAVNKAGNVYAWGRQEYGLTEVPAEIQGHAKQITAGTHHVSVLLDDGSVRTWGDQALGQCNAPGDNGYALISGGNNGTVYIKDEAHGFKAGGWGQKGYIFGSDENGRDIFRRLIYGGRMSLTVGAVAVIISAIIGIIIGSIAGYYGGWVDTFLMRFAEVVGSIPFLPLAMILSAILSKDISETGRIVMIMVILGVLSWPGLAWLLRGQILAVREQEYVTAAKSLGIREKAIMFKHILPNVINVVLVSVTLSFATSILTESTLSFLGFGVTLPTPTWGNMVYAASTSNVVADFWWRWFFPSLALAISTLSINQIGDSLRDAVDPKSLGR